MSTTDTPPERTAFKDWFDEQAAAQLADQLSAAWREFDRRKFLRLAKTDLSSLEFQARVKQFAAALAATLPEDVPEALDILTRSLPPARHDCEEISDGWLQWPLGHFIAEYATDHFDPAFRAMTELTTRFTSEFAVRPYVERYPDRIFPRLLDLCASPNPHIRRWCSEGTRTRLPWGRKLHALIEDPSPILPILEALKDDDELYVRRSVANNLNDLAKDHPDLVVSTAKKWMKGASEERAWIVRHALRTLIKDGHPGALEVMGFHPPNGIEATFSLSPAGIAIGDFVEMEATLLNRENVSRKIAVDYAVHYVRKANKISAKVFKWKTLELPAGESTTLQKKHPMRVTTVRALYPGAHKVELQVNGVRLAGGSFALM